MLEEKSGICYVFGMLEGANISRDTADLLQEKDRQIASLHAQVALLQEQLTWLKTQLFGAKSERIVADLGQQSLPFAADELVASPPVEATEEIHYQRRKAVKKRDGDTLSYPDDVLVVTQG